jgi:hypothetical protein
VSVDVVCEVRIARPRAEVGAYMFDPRNDLEWTKGVTSSRPLSGLPLEAGSRVERVARFLGREFAYVYEVTGIEEGRFMAMRATRPFPMEIRYELEDVERGTLARIRASGDASGFFTLAAPLLARRVRRSIQRDLDALGRRLEPAPAG